MTQIDWSKAPEGATHWSPENAKGRLEAYWRPDGDGMYDCWAVTDSYGGNKWQQNRADLPEYAVALPTAWTGEGLPPVGAVCEAKTTRGWSRGTIIAHGLPPKENLAVWQEDGELIFWGVKEYFRPIRTPEQIAADEREKTIDDLKTVFDSISHELCATSNKYLETLFGAIHEAGYRKMMSDAEEVKS